MLTIVCTPNPVLSQKAKEVHKIDNSIRSLIKHMKQTLIAQKDPEGVGLAAPQVNTSLQIFIVKPSPKSPEQVFINPEIQPIKTKKRANEQSSSVKLEGCLSLPSIWAEVKRAESITVSYLNEEGEKKTETFSGFPATIVQHEFDHLQGILFTKRVLEQKSQLYKSHKEKGKDVFEEINL